MAQSAFFKIISTLRITSFRQEDRTTARRPEALSVARSGGGASRNSLAPPPHHVAPRTPQDVPPVTLAKWNRLESQYANVTLTEAFPVAVAEMQHRPRGGRRRRERGGERRQCAGRRRPPRLALRGPPARGRAGRAAPAAPGAARRQPHPGTPSFRFLGQQCSYLVIIAVTPLPHSESVGLEAGDTKLFRLTYSINFANIYTMYDRMRSNSTVRSPRRSPETPLLLMGPQGTICTTSIIHLNYNLL